MALLFEWDPKKARGNVKKHSVTFDEASTAFQDIMSITISDPAHSKDEERFVLLGCSHQNRLLVVVHTERRDCIRIISARAATGKEKLRYEESA